MSEASATTTTTTRGQISTARLHRAALAAVRIVVSFLFACHGAQGLFGAFGGVDGQGTAVPFGIWPGWWASAIEFAGGVLILLGLGTRPLAVLSSGAMAYAYFVVHQPMGLLPLQNMGEQAALFCWIFLLIAVLGPGSFAVDNLLRRKRR
ncbi:DoxX family protein [Amycolatopsis anabasis]|uniref:DoxX family protein n=1 Tax=Amycolatopsis anabasis TaxID=1840409 RepID=UPI00131D37E5|nr:DoxX family protein [Amycolatopsis anabasis]